MPTDVCRHIRLKICDFTEVDSILSVLMPRTSLQQQKHMYGAMADCFGYHMENVVAKVGDSCLVAYQ